MSKITLPDIGSLANTASARTAINDNFAAIADALDNTISRDGTTPNQMEADLDLNSNKIINVADPVDDLDAVNKRSVEPLVNEFAQAIVETHIEGTARLERFFATDGQTEFTLEDSPGSTKNMYVFDSGIAMSPDIDFTLTGSDLKTLTFFVGRSLGSEIVVRYMELAPADSVVRSDLFTKATGRGSDMIRFNDSRTSTTQTMTDIVDGMEISILRFIPPEYHDDILAGVSSVDVSTYFQAAFDAAENYNGIHLIVPKGAYYINNQVATNYDNISISGRGKPLLVIGTGKAAGTQMFLIRNNYFAARGMEIYSPTKTHCFYVQPPAAADLTGFTFEELEGRGLFYMVRCDGAADRLVRDVLVKNCKNTAPVGTNCGHFMVDHGVGVQYLGNTIRYGNFTSGYGVADSTNIVIANNIEQDMEDTGAATEAACQIEDCENANAVITGNSFEHDIWVSGSGNVRVEGNTCRRMRVSIGNTDGYNVRKVSFSNNTAAQIHVAKFGGTTPPERISARFINNDLDPSGRTVNGSAISSLVYSEGSWITSLELRGNRALSDASTNACIMSRSATTTYRVFDNDFGSLTHSVSGGSVGKLYERGNRNKLTKTGNGYCEAALTSTFTLTIGAWSPLTLNSETVDVNAEWSGATFTAGEAGTYRFSGIMTIIPTAAGNQLGLRLTRSGTEIARLCYLNAQSTNSQGLAMRSVDYYLAAGDVVQLEYFVQGASTQFSTGANVCNFQITRLD